MGSECGYATVSVAPLLWRGWRRYARLPRRICIYSLDDCCRVSVSLLLSLCRYICVDLLYYAMLKRVIYQPTKSTTDSQSRTVLGKTEKDARLWSVLGYYSLPTLPVYSNSTDGLSILLRLMGLITYDSLFGPCTNR